jgi:hypothetical protein
MPSRAYCDKRLLIFVVETLRYLGSRFYEFLWIVTMGWSPIVLVFTGVLLSLCTLALAFYYLLFLVLK